MPVWEEGYLLKHGEFLFKETAAAIIKETEDKRGVLSTDQFRLFFSTGRFDPVSIEEANALDSASKFPIKLAIRDKGTGEVRYKEEGGEEYIPFIESAGYSPLETSIMAAAGPGNLTNEQVRHIAGLLGKAVPDFNTFK